VHDGAKRRDDDTCGRAHTGYRATHDPALHRGGDIKPSGHDDAKCRAHLGRILRERTVAEL